MDGWSITLTLIAAGLIGCSFGIVLAIASVKLRVVVDPRIELICEMLPGANCGGCGYPGCTGYAASVVNDSVDVSLCAPGGAGISCDIAKVMGQTVEDKERLIAVCHCQGTRERSPDRWTYDGPVTCATATALHGGPKSCTYGCLGYGDCVKSCQFNALVPGIDGIPVTIPDRCTSCGACVRACPRSLMKMIPAKADFYLACNNRDKAKVAKAVCKVACTACKLCVKKGPEGGMVMAEGANLPEICYDALVSWPEANDTCPQNCYVEMKSAAQAKAAS
ncbi:MAG: RnfABCDGE type electron transport complex subunit B [Planctomycetota bacterium]|jgi:Na+-translocating ferredoxin:NAD+ oxidoreductase RNF subunit RnfB